MSIASEITALTADRDAIRAVLVNKGVTAASTHGFDDFADDIDSITPGDPITITETPDSHGGTILEISTTGLDLSNDTVAPNKLLSGYTAHDASGTLITGTYVVPPITEKDVNFYDYDGTLLYSYSAEEFLTLTEMPPAPSHTGLISQGWNWTLMEAQAYVQENAYLAVGQMYITDDNKTRFYVTFSDPADLDLCLYFRLNGAVVVDWGDGTATQRVTGSSLSMSVSTPDHFYSTTGSYVITLDVESGSLCFSVSSSSYSIFRHALTDYVASGTYYNQGVKSILKKIEFGTGIASDNDTGFSGYPCLESVTIPEYFTEIGAYSFPSCSALKAVIIPHYVTSVGSNSFYACIGLEVVSMPRYCRSIGSSAFSGCTHLRVLNLPDDPDNDVRAFQYAFRNIGIKKLVIPESFLTQASGVFSQCGFLQDVTICCDTSDSTELFAECPSLTRAVFANNSAPVPYRMFYNCFSLKTVVLSNALTSISQTAFLGCMSLCGISLPNSVTTLNTGCFSSCYSLISMVIPSSVTDIGSSVFEYCYGIRAIHFSSSTPPTAAADAFSNLPNKCRIYVPTGSLSAYTSAANYPSSSTYTYIEE